MCILFGLMMNQSMILAAPEKENKENDRVDDFIYRNHVSGSPLEAIATDGVDISTGKLILTRSDMTLEGKGGLDFELTRYYNSDESKLVSSRENEQGSLGAYHIGAGWSYDIPWIEMVDGEESNNKIPSILHFGSIGCMGIKTDKIDDKGKYRIIGIEGYHYDDIMLSDYENNAEDKGFCYLLRDKTGRRTYFNEYGLVVLIKDKYDNRIHFKYNDTDRLVEILDSAGRRIEFEYDKDYPERLSNVAVNGKESDGGVRKKIVRYEYSDSDSAVLKSAIVNGKEEQYEYIINHSSGDELGDNDVCLINRIISNSRVDVYNYDIDKDNTKGHCNVVNQWSEDTTSGSKSFGYIYNYIFEGGKRISIVSSFNPNDEMSKTKGGLFDKNDLDIDSYRFKELPRREVDVVEFNEDRLETKRVSYRKNIEEIYKKYDKKGSLLIEETSVSYDDFGKECERSTYGYTYDRYRNRIEEIEPRAYSQGGKGNEKLFKTVYKYYDREKGYPDNDIPYTKDTILSEESYISESTCMMTQNEISEDGINIVSSSRKYNTDGNGYRTVSKNVMKYDKYGNITQDISYPLFATCGEKECIVTNSIYNNMGQEIEQDIKVCSDKNPDSNADYVNMKSEYDYFGNKIESVDDNGNITRYKYNLDTGELEKTISNAGTVYEGKTETITSKDGLKNITKDESGNQSITIYDPLGNIISVNDELNKTRTEKKYISSRASAKSLVESEYTYILDSGNKSRVLSSTRHLYDDFGEEIGMASFLNGEQDAKHCESWNVMMFTKKSLNKDDIEREYGVVDGITVSSGKSFTCIESKKKELDPTHYTCDQISDDYYNRYDEFVLREINKTTILDMAGNVIGEISIIISGNNRQITSKIYKYNPLGKIIKESIVVTSVKEREKQPDFITEKVYEYDDNGNNTCITSRNKNDKEEKWVEKKIKREYDEFGHLIKEYTSNIEDNIPIDYEYDICGNIIRERIPQKKDGEKIFYEIIDSRYDYHGNLVEKKVHLDGNKYKTSEYGYDIANNLISVKSSTEKGKSSFAQYLYDSKGRKIRQFTGLSRLARIEVKEGKDVSNDNYYDGGKEYSIIISGLNKLDELSETKYEYNKKGEIFSITEPNGRKETYTYDLVGNLTSDRIENVKEIINKYDSLNRLVSTTERNLENKNETVKSFWYDKYGRVNQTKETTAEGSTVETRNTYDALTDNSIGERIILESGVVLEKEYSYDSAGNKKSLIIKKGKDILYSLNYEYDGDSKVISVSKDDGDVISEYEYDNDQRLTLKKSGPVFSSYDYDIRGHLLNVTNRDKNNTELSSFSSQYGLSGKKIREDYLYYDHDGKLIKGNTSYGYDLLGRVISEKRTGEKTVYYTYDLRGNRKTCRIGSKTITYYYNKNNELIKTTVSSGVLERMIQKYKVDKGGNQLTNTHQNVFSIERLLDLIIGNKNNAGDDPVMNEYDGCNRLIKTKTKDHEIEYEYYPDGLRLSKSVNGNKTYYIWDEDKLILELSPNGGVARRYFHGNTTVCGNDLICSDKGIGSKKTFFVYDTHGNVIQLVDENGSVLQSYKYDSFGNEKAPNEKDDNPFRYCGEYYDIETGSIYLRARYYQPVNGRFLTKDTYTGEEDDPATLHLYTYCMNDGVNYWDPSGHWAFSENGNVMTSEGTKLRVCTDGKVKGKLCGASEKPYGDKNHKRHTAAFEVKKDKNHAEDDISADGIPYIVVPKSKIGPYKFSSGVIINKNNGNYLYAIVAESGPNDNGMGEVSIQAAWTMAKPSDINIGNKSQEGNWKILVYKESAPNPNGYHCGYSMGNLALNNEIASNGSKYFPKSQRKGKCLNGEIIEKFI